MLHIIGGPINRITQVLSPQRLLNPQPSTKTCQRSESQTQSTKYNIFMRHHRKTKEKTTPSTKLKIQPKNNHSAVLPVPAALPLKNNQQVTYTFLDLISHNWIGINHAHILSVFAASQVQYPNIVSTRQLSSWVHFHSISL